LAHHDPIQTETFVLSVPEPGSWDVGWTVHARNLPRPQEGKLYVELRYKEDGDMAPVTSLKSLLAAGQPVGE
jgi:hypothetical protein